MVQRSSFDEHSAHYDALLNEERIGRGLPAEPTHSPGSKPMLAIYEETEAELDDYEGLSFEAEGEPPEPPKKAA